MKNLFSLLCILGLVSCDPVVNYDKIIQNDSSYDIWLIKSDSTSSAEFIKDSVLLISRESIVIDGIFDIGGSLSGFESCPAYPFPGDTLFTRIAQNSNLKLNVVIDENADWQYKILEPGNDGSAECRLTLSDSDIAQSN